jgi:hypothetical protein
LLRIAIAWRLWSTWRDTTQPGRFHAAFVHITESWGSGEHRRCFMQGRTAESGRGWRQPGNRPMRLRGRYWAAQPGR